GAFGRVGNDGHRNLRGMTGHRPVIAIKKHWGLGISSRHHRASSDFVILFLFQSDGISGAALQELRGTLRSGGGAHSPAHKPVAE
ncbi:hypothetical protein ACW7BJ_35185, partial [Azospirillum argentinense]